MKKNKPAVGLKKEVINLKKKKERLPPEKFFRDAKIVWDEVYGEVMPNIDGEKAKPEFWNDGAEQRALKTVLISLRQRAEEKSVVWTLDEMKKRLRCFLLKAKEDRFIGDNYMLRIINNNKTKIFNNQITPKTDGRKDNTTRTGFTPVVTAKPKGGFGKL